MEGRLLFKNCALVRADGQTRLGACVVVEDTVITRVADDAEIPTRPGDWEVACQGRALMPGRVDAHAHSTVAALEEETAASWLSTGPQFLRAPLQVTEVEALSAQAFVTALRSGITCVAEHLEAPINSSAALFAQARVAERMGIRLIQSLATRSHPDGDSVDVQLAANAAQVRAYQHNPTVRVALGFDACFTSEDGLLEALARTREALGCSVHFHLGQHAQDLTTTYSRWGIRIVQRLEQFGLLGEFAVAYSGHMLDRAEAQRVLASGTLVAVRSDEEVFGSAGGGGLATWLQQPRHVALATGGRGALRDAEGALLATFARLRKTGRAIAADDAFASVVLGGPAELVRRMFGQPFGEVDVGALADLVLYDWVPGVVKSSVWSVLRAQVSWSVVGGRVLLREGQVLGVDGLALAREAARVRAARRSS